MLAFAGSLAGVAAVAELAPGWGRPSRISRGRGGAAAIALASRVGRLVLAPGLRDLADLDARLVAAGRPGGMRARDFLAVKAGGTLIACAGGLVAGTVLPGRLAMLAAIAAPVAGFVAPDLWLGRARRRRDAEVRRDLPALLDLLRVTVEAGMPLAAALAHVAGRSRAPLARLWGGLAAQVIVGVPLHAALESHRRAVPIPEIEAFTAAVARSSRHGAPLSDTLAAQAREARLARRHALRERAGRAAPKMQLVVAALLVPSVMLLVAAALLSALAGGGAEATLSGF